MGTIQDTQPDSGTAMLRSSFRGLIASLLLVICLAPLVSLTFYFIWIAGGSGGGESAGWVFAVLAGITGAISARFVLKGRTLTLQFLATTLALLLSLWAQAWISAGEIGMQGGDRMSWHKAAVLIAGLLVEVPVLLSFRGNRSGMKIRSDQPRVITSSGKTSPKKKNISGAAVPRKTKVAKKTNSSAPGVKPKKRPQSSAKSGTKKTGAGKSAAGRRKPKLRTGSGSTAKAKKTASGTTRRKVKMPRGIRSTSQDITSGAYWKRRWRSLQAGTSRVIDNGSKRTRDLSAALKRSIQKPKVHVRSRTSRKVIPKRRLSNPNYVNLRGEVEHRCPYCLEEIRKGDPRGVKICPVCKTRHHSDCWSVTGTCQVPHE